MAARPQFSMSRMRKVFFSNFHGIECEQEQKKTLYQLYAHVTWIMDYVIISRIKKIHNPLSNEQ